MAGRSVCKRCSEITIAINARAIAMRVDLVRLLVARLGRICCGRNATDRSMAIKIPQAVRFEQWIYLQKVYVAPCILCVCIIRRPIYSSACCDICFKLQIVRAHNHKESCAHRIASLQIGAKLLGARREHIAINDFQLKRYLYVCGGGGGGLEGNAQHIVGQPVQNLANMRMEWQFCMDAVAWCESDHHTACVLIHRCIQ